MRVADFNWMQLERYLERDVPNRAPARFHEMLRVWRAGVEEVRELLERGWRDAI